LEDMFKDIFRSKELMFNFRQKYSDFETALNVSVCTTGAWPISTVYSVKKPSDIAEVIDRFTQFYLDRLSQRCLIFQMDKGNAEVSVQFNATTEKILVVSTYQMMLLLLFNQKSTWTFGEMREATGIPIDYLIEAAHSMAHPNVKVMRKAPNTNEVRDGDEYQINPEYSNPKATIHIPTPRMKLKNALKKIHEKKMEAVYRLRRHQMDAAIVRIMKARRTLKHRELVAEVVKQLGGRLRPEHVDVKMRIAIMIDLEYLARDANDGQIYHYLA